MSFSRKATRWNLRLPRTGYTGGEIDFPMRLLQYSLAWRNPLLATALLLLNGCALDFVRSPIGDRWRAAGPPLPRSGPHFDRVLSIVFENQNREAVLADPYFAELARNGANFTDFHGLFHPSYSNYLAMVSGKALVTHFDRQKDFPDRTIGELLTAKQLTWKNYAEEFPGNCFMGSKNRRYARKHVPFMSFTPVRQNGCGNVVDAAQFATDLQSGTLPTYSFYSPDLDHDGHDPVTNPAAGLEKSSAWLRGFLQSLQSKPTAMKGLLIVITYDESGKKGSDENLIYTVLLGDMVKPAEYGGNYNHFNVLRTIEDNFGLGTLGDGDGAARPIVEIWK